MSTPATPTPPRRTAAAVSKELKQLGKRRVELAAALESTTREHTEARERLVKGDASVASGTVALHFAACSSLREAVGEVDTRISQLTQEHEQAQAWENDAETRAKVDELEQQAMVHLKNYEAERAAGARAMQKHFTAAAEAWSRYKRTLNELRFLDKTRRDPQLKYESFGILDGPIQIALQSCYDKHTRPGRGERMTRLRELSQREQAAQAKQGSPVTKAAERMPGWTRLSAERGAGGAGAAAGEGDEAA